jgi:stage V sporulation protein S
MVDVASKLDQPLNDIINQDQKEEGDQTGGRQRGQRPQYQVKELSYNYTRILKVSAKSNPKNVAGSISHTSRSGDSPTLMATGAVSINQAVKSIAIARGYLEDNKLDLSVSPEFRNEERGAISFVLTKTALRRPANQTGQQPNEETQELRVAQASEPSVVAGSIAKKVRAGERVCVVSIGAGSVSQTVRAITIARRYLEKDNVDISFRPEFIHVEMKDGQRSAIKFQILAQQL